MRYKEVILPFFLSRMVKIYCTNLSYTKIYHKTTKKMINMKVNGQYAKPCSMKISPFCFSGSHLENCGNRDGQ